MAPLVADVADALDRWCQVRDQIPELAGDNLLFPRLGRRLRDGRFPDAGGQMTLARKSRSWSLSTTPRTLEPDRVAGRSLRCDQAFVRSPRRGDTRACSASGHRIATPQTFFGASLGRHLDRAVRGVAPSEAILSGSANGRLFMVRRRS